MRYVELRIWFPKWFWKTTYTYILAPFDLFYLECVCKFAVVTMHLVPDFFISTVSVDFDGCTLILMKIWA